MANYQAIRQGRELIGDSVARVLNWLVATHGEVKVVAIVPRVMAPMVAITPSPNYEVIEADIIVEHKS